MNEKREQFTTGGLFALIALIGGWAHMRLVELEKLNSANAAKVAAIEAALKVSEGNFEKSLGEIKAIVQMTQGQISDIRVLIERKQDRRK